MPRRKLSDTEELVLLEVIKCLRVLLNTAPGYPYVIETPTIVTHIAFALHGASPKLRALSSDLLAAICVISLNEGHRLVLGALSDYKICFDEAFRFEELIDALRVEENAQSQEGEDDGSWESRGATMGLIIALTSCSDSIEDRILLREEFSRRGLNEVMVVSAHLLHRLSCSNRNPNRDYDISNHPMLCSSSSTPTPRINMKTKMTCGISCVV